MMKVPSPAEADMILSEAEKMNPGIWVDHCKVAGRCAETIAKKCPGMDSGAAYSMGLLHDIGRRVGVCDLKHVVAGYGFMMEQGYDDCARICLTHSFPFQNILTYAGKNDISQEDTDFLREQITNMEYDDYDRLIQICDVMAYPSGPCVLEKRMVDVCIRRGLNEFTIDKWKKELELKDYFQEKIGGSIYSLFDDLVL